MRNKGQVPRQGWGDIIAHTIPQLLEAMTPWVYPERLQQLHPQVLIKQPMEQRAWIHHTSWNRATFDATAHQAKLQWHILHVLHYLHL